MSLRNWFFGPKKEKEFQLMDFKEACEKYNLSLKRIEKLNKQEEKND